MTHHKTAQFIEELNSAISVEGNRIRQRNTRSDRGKKRPNYNPKSKANLRPKSFPKGTSGNPRGLPGTDVAAVIARRIFEQTGNAVTAGMAKQLEKGSAYAFSVLADRAYGKVKEHQRVEHSGLNESPLAITIKFVEPDGSAGQKR